MIDEVDVYYVAIAFHVPDIDIRIQVKLIRKCGSCRLHDFRIGQWSNLSADTKHVHFDTKTVQRLTQFEADYARTKHGHGFRQITPVEDVVVNDEAIAEFVPYMRITRRRAGRDDDSFCLDDGMVVDLQSMIVEKACVPPNSLFFGNVLDAVDDKADKAIPLAPDAIHDGNAIDVYATDVDAETRGFMCGMRSFGRRNQQLARHAAYARAGRSVRPAFDQHDLVRPFAGGAECPQAGGACTDDGYVDVACSHFVSPECVC